MMNNVNKITIDGFEYYFCDGENGYEFVYDDCVVFNVGEHDITKVLYSILNLRDFRIEDEDYNFILRSNRFGTFYLNNGNGDTVTLSYKEALFLFEYFLYLITHD